jgi:trimethylamine--corrinoid protein Co-methyltransferase
MAAQRPRLQFLAERELERIEQTAYRLLDEVGISLEHAAATERLHGLGCRVADGRVFIPTDVVDWALKNVSAGATLHSADGNREVTLGDGQLRFHNGGSDPFVLDQQSGRRRPALLSDVAEFARLLDALPNVDVVIPMVGPQDAPKELLAIAAFDTLVRHTRKPVSAAPAEGPDDVRYQVELAAACCGGMDAFRCRPTLSISVSPVSPLRFIEKGTAAIMAIADSGAAFHSLPAPSLGATGPVTLAGALAQQHAEVLASFVIVAATRPGAPVVYCSRVNPIDMRSAVSSWGGPEVGLTGACAAQLAHRLGLPCDAYGLCTSAAKIDPQFAYERLMNAMLPALAGADILSGVGSMDSGLIASLDIAALDNEIIGLMKYVLGGCPVNEATLAFDVMREVIPRDGVFLGEWHTVEHMRKGALWTPGLSERKSSSTDDPMAGVMVRTRQQVTHLLQTHPMEPLPAAVTRQLDEIMREARRELVH